MKYRIYIIFPLVLFYNILQSQDATISKDQWHKIINQTNVVVTSIYIENQNQSDKLDEEQSRNYLEVLKPRFAKTSLSESLSLKPLFKLLKPEFEITFNNLTSKIEDIRGKEKNLDSLKENVNRILTEVSGVQLIGSKTLKNHFIDVEAFVQSETKNIESQHLIATPESGAAKNRNSHLTLSNFIIVLLLFGLLILIFIMNKKSNNQKRLLLKLQNELDFERSKENGNHNQLNKFRNKVIELEEEVKLLQEFRPKEVEAFKNELMHDVISKEIELKIASPDVTTQNEFYSGKPSSDRKFLEISDKIKEQETVFKFKIADNSRTEASFEVIIASEFMKRQITNAPDDFLYRVCNNMNSNQDFRKEVVTERKGLAHFREDSWVVDENDKALIKFQ